MKRFFLIFIALFSLAFVAQAADSETDASWDNANTLYVNEDFQGAIVAYDSIISAGNISHKLYYNIANAHFKVGNIGEAILYYNRALRLAPNDADTKHNLAITTGYVKDKIEVVPEFILSQWMRGIRTSLSSNAWAFLAVIFLALSLALVLMYLLSKDFSRRKLGFFGSILFLVLTSFSLVSSSIQKRDILESSVAVIVDASASVKSSPNSTSTDIFVLHEGTTVQILQRMGRWSEIMIADGNKGWIEHSAIKRI